MRADSNFFYIVYEVVPRDPPIWADLEQQLVFISRTKAERYIKNHQGIFILQEIWGQRWIEGKPSPVKLREAKDWKRRDLEMKSNLRLALPLSLQAKILRNVTQFAANYKMKKEVVAKIIKDINEDLILPTLNLGNNAVVYTKVDHHSENKDPKYADLLLYVGQRDFQWSIRTGELIGAGTSLCKDFNPDTDLPKKVPNK